MPYLYAHRLDGNPIERKVHSGLIEVANSMQHDSKNLFLLQSVTSCSNTVVGYETFV